MKVATFVRRPFFDLQIFTPKLLKHQTRNIHDTPISGPA